MVIDVGCQILQAWSGRKTKDGLRSMVYGKPLNLGYDFHEMSQGARFKVSESARREILSRLLRLNHERYEEKQRMNDEGGMIKEGKKKVARKKKNADGDDVPRLFN